jgi:thiosulfate/3-mercaptopyruvate sulfurtransferase
MSEYAHDVLVTADWVEERLDEAQRDDPALRLVEVNSPESPDEDFPSRYDDGHIPGAVGFQWDEDLSDDTERDILAKAAFEQVVGDAGIADDSTVVFYGDGWIANWVDNDYPMTTDEPDFTPREYDARGPFEGIRAYKDDVEQAIESGIPLVDVRSPEEFSGEIIAPEGLRETAQVGGHIPTASNVPVKTALNDDGTFKSADELRDLYAARGVTEDQAVVTYCRVGERSAIAWFVLRELLGFDDVENYDGSWTEWGNTVRAPVVTGGDE